MSYLRVRSLAPASLQCCCQAAQDRPLQLFVSAEGASRASIQLNRLHFNSIQLEMCTQMTSPKQNCHPSKQMSNIVHLIQITHVLVQENCISIE